LIKRRTANIHLIAYPVFQQFISVALNRKVKKNIKKNGCLLIEEKSKNKPVQIVIISRKKFGLEGE